MDFRYLIGTGIFFVIWLALFLYRKKLRKEMVVMSLLVMPLGPLAEILHFGDYWNPGYIFTFMGVGIEDVLYAFFIGGIAAVIYEEFFITKFKRVKAESNSKMIALAIAGLVIFIVLNTIFKINSIHASSIGFLIIGAIMLFKRRDLIKHAFMSGVLVALVTFVFYLIYVAMFPGIIQEWWQLENLSGILILGMPIEELTWAFAWGFFIGPIYEFWQGRRGVEIK